MVNEEVEVEEASIWGQPSDVDFLAPATTVDEYQDMLEEDVADDVWAEEIYAEEIVEE